MGSNAGDSMLGQPGIQRISAITTNTNGGSVGQQPDFNDNASQGSRKGSFKTNKMELFVNNSNSGSTAQGKKNPIDSGHE